VYERQVSDQTLAGVSLIIAAASRHLHTVHAREIAVGFPAEETRDPIRAVAAADVRARRADVEFEMNPPAAARTGTTPGQTRYVSELEEALT
jgi:hypothetical protein